MRASQRPGVDSEGDARPGQGQWEIQELEIEQAKHPCHRNYAHESGVDNLSHVVIELSPQPRLRVVLILISLV